jgi:hypothetical protein
MVTDLEQKVISWLRKRTVATMRQMRHQFQISHMTVVRALRETGYYASYNYNAAYYVLQDVPKFDDWGLWAYKDIRFSYFHSLPATIVAVVSKAPAGLTVHELEERLQTKVANAVSCLASKGHVQRERIIGHQMIYLAGDLEIRTQQLEKRQKLLPQESASGKLPPGCSATEVIEVLRRMILTSDDDAERLARELQSIGTRIRASQVRRVLDYYGVKKNATSEDS